MSKDYYKVLGLSRGASADEVKRAFRELAHKHHPDKAGGDAQKFKEINEAYQVLSSLEKRAQYDRYGTTFDQAQAGGFGGFSGGGGGGFGGFSGANFDFGDLSDILGDLFGTSFGGRRGERAAAAAKGDDVEIPLTLTFREAAFGAEKKVQLKGLTICEYCGGRGAEPGSKQSSCSTCGGLGQVRATQNTIFGSMSSVRACSKCAGAGSVVEQVCKVCRGDGRVRGAREISLDIPPGVESGETLRVAGAGDTGHRGGANGDLFVRVTVQKDPYFAAEGKNVITNMDITFAQAALGDKIALQTLDGEVELKIPAGVQHGERLRLKGRGIKDGGRGGRGDHLVLINIVTPQKLSRRSRELFEELKREEDGKN